MPTQKAAAKKKKPVSKKTPPAGKATRPAKKPAPSAKNKAPAPVGRPKIPGDADLDLVFKEDYEARQCFKFLGVHSVWELERIGPDELLDILAQPVKRLVDRIRQKLAQNNRFLAGDRDFVRLYHAQRSGG
jgi:hypothetical protein